MKSYRPPRSRRRPSRRPFWLVAGCKSSPPRPPCPTPPSHPRLCSRLLCAGAFQPVNPLPPPSPESTPPTPFSFFFFLSHLPPQRRLPTHMYTGGGTHVVHLHMVRYGQSTPES